MSRDLPLKEVPCATCGAIQLRQRVRRDVQCRDCRKAEVHQWYMDHREECCAAERERWRNGTKKQQQAAWIASHRARFLRNRRKSNKTYTQKMRALAREADAYTCYCGAPHTQERRLAVLRRCADLSAAEIREAYPCLWPCERTLYRDRALLSEKQRAA